MRGWRYQKRLGYYGVVGIGSATRVTLESVWCKENVMPLVVVWKI